MIEKIEELNLSIWHGIINYSPTDRIIFPIIFIVSLILIMIGCIRLKIGYEGKLIDFICLLSINHMMLMIESIHKHLNDCISTTTWIIFQSDNYQSQLSKISGIKDMDKDIVSAYLLRIAYEDKSALLKAEPHALYEHFFNAFERILVVPGFGPLNATCPIMMYLLIGLFVISSIYILLKDELTIFDIANLLINIGIIIFVIKCGIRWTMASLIVFIMIALINFIYFTINYSKTKHNDEKFNIL